MKLVLFVCVENAGRSQMAEAFTNHYGKGEVVASSAGFMLADRVNPVVVEAMKEKGIDISMSKPKLLTTKMAEEADKIITMGCSVEKVRQIRDEIERRALELIQSLSINKKE